MVYEIRIRLQSEGLTTENLSEILLVIDFLILMFLFRCMMCIIFYLFDLNFITLKYSFVCIVCITYFKTILQYIAFGNHFGKITVWDLQSLDPLNSNSKSTSVW